jgi:toxin ParE1/3/4
MPLPFRRSPRAIADLAEYARYIFRDNPGVAERFAAAAESTFAKIADMPEMGRVWQPEEPRLSRVRRISLPSPFDNYLVFYRHDHNELQILRVLHAARDLSDLVF